MKGSRAKPSAISGNGQLYRPPERACRELNDLISRQHLLTDEDIGNILSGRTSGITTNVDRNHDDEMAEEPVEHKLLRRAFHRRRAEIRRLTADWKEGRGARIDEDGRLVPVTGPPQPPRVRLPPGPAAAARFGRGDIGNNHHDADNQLIGGGGDGGNINNNDNNLNDQQHEEQIFEQERQEAEATIAQTVQRLRNQGVPEEDFEVILLNPRGALGLPPAVGGGLNNLTVRRILFAVLAVLSAFAFLILKALPLLATPESLDPYFDKLLYELLDVRTWTTHIQECSDLENRSPPGSLNRNGEDGSLWKRWKTNRKTANTDPYSLNNITDCSDGVLHIPSKHVFFEDYLRRKYSMEQENQFRHDYAFHGVDVAWFIPCVPNRRQRHSQNFDLQEGLILDQKQECSLEKTGEIPMSLSPREHCFRGVHDNLIREEDIDESLKLGSYLIRNGADHFDVHYDVSHLERRLPKMMKTLRSLLEAKYRFKKKRIGSNLVQPVAFRVLTTGPMDGHGVTLHNSTVTVLNHTTYLDWIERSRQQNDRAYYSLPWPFRVAPKRDTCKLMADLQADSRFCIQTSVFLVDGAGRSYRGGSSLFVDYDPSNDNPKHRIQRGVTVDGSRGRVVVASGGFENLHCRLPVRVGLRVVLQIWWDCME